MSGDRLAQHPESYCHRCHGSNVSWVAPSPLWNSVMRGGDINGYELYDGIVCPACFAGLAEDAGIAHGWRFTAEVVSVELQTVTPSGRVWNEETWLWDDAPALARLDSGASRSVTSGTDTTEGDAA